MSGIETKRKRSCRGIVSPSSTRNCGASDVVIDGDESEYEIWADDVHELLSQLGALPAFVGGSSSAVVHHCYSLCATLISARPLALARHGGRFACERLAEEYYGQYIKAAQRRHGCVCEMEHWKERIAARPENRDALMRLKPNVLSRSCHTGATFSEGHRSSGDRRHRAGTKVDQSACLYCSRQRQHSRAPNRRSSRTPDPAKRSAYFVSKHYDEHFESAEEWDEKAVRWPPCLLTL
jgi:hypothetical protein